MGSSHETSKFHQEGLPPHLRATKESKSYSEPDGVKVNACHFDKEQFDSFTGRLKKTAIPRLFPTHTIKTVSEGADPDSFEYDYEATPISVVNSIDNITVMTMREPMKLILPKSVETAQVPFSCGKTLAPEPPLPLSGVDFVEFISPPVIAEITEPKEVEAPQPIGQDRSIPKPKFILPKIDTVLSSANSEKTGVSEVYYVMEQCTGSDSSPPMNHEETENNEIKSHLEVLARERDDLRREVYRLRKKITYQSKIMRRFNDDELASLSGKKVRQWSEETYNKCLETRLAVGKKGYDFLLKQGYPLVSYASLCRFIQKLAEKKELSQSVAADLAEETSSIANSPSSSSDYDYSDVNEEDIS